MLIAWQIVGIYILSIIGYINTEDGDELKGEKGNIK